VATRNPTLGANVGVKIEIVATGASIKVHDVTPSNTIAAKDTSPIRRIIGDFAAPPMRDHIPGRTGTWFSQTRITARRPVHTHGSENNIGHVTKRKVGGGV
jgi:hypothetical protein